MKMCCELIVESDGREVYRGKSKSFLQNAGKIIRVLFASKGNIPLSATGSTSTTITDTGNVSRTVYGEWYSGTSAGYGGGTPAAMNAADNDDSYGIVVGSGSTPVSPTDYSLASKISHGTGAGQLDYDVHTVTTSYSSTSSYVEISRVFVNKSNSDVIVREVGLMARNYWKDFGAVRNDVKFLIARDVLPTPVIVKPLGSLTVRYRISLSL
jgi:hypothetical protein